MGRDGKGRKLGYTVSQIFKLGSLLELLQHKMCETTADLEITQELSPDVLWTSTAKGDKLSEHAHLYVNKC